MRTVVHYGTCSLAYSGYILQGMHRLATDQLIELKIKRGAPADLRAAANGHPHMQMIPVFDAVDGSDRARFCIDNHDKADFIHPGLIDNVDCYFKLNHDPDVIAGLDLTPAQRKRIAALGVPISPMRPVRWPHRPRLRPAPELAWGPRDVVRRIRHLRQLSTLDDLCALRSTPKTVDVTFVNRIYAQPHHRPVNDFRYEVGSRLASHPDINAKVGLIGPGVTGKFARYAAEEDTPEDHLHQLASSRIGIYVWGTHHCLSFKMCELLALGLPVIGQTIPQDRANLSPLPRLGEQFAFDDPQELVDAVVALLGDDARRAELGRSNMALFDSHLAPRPNAKRVIDRVFDRVGS